MGGYPAQATRVLLASHLPGPSTDLHGPLGAQWVLREERRLSAKGQAAHPALPSDPSSAMVEGTELRAFGPWLLHIKSRYHPDLTEYHPDALGPGGGVVIPENFCFVCLDLSPFHL